MYNDNNSRALVIYVPQETSNDSFSRLKERYNRFIKNFSKSFRANISIYISFSLVYFLFFYSSAVICSNSRQFSFLFTDFLELYLFDGLLIAFFLIIFLTAFTFWGRVLPFIASAVTGFFLGVIEYAFIFIKFTDNTANCLLLSLAIASASCLFIFFCSDVYLNSKTPILRFLSGDFLKHYLQYFVKSGLKIYILFHLFSTIIYYFMLG